MAEGLFGFSPEDQQALQQMMAQFGASEQDRKDANKQAAFAFGFGLLAHPYKGQELQALGNAGMNAMGTRQQLLNDIPKQKMATIGPALALRKFARNEQFSRDLLGSGGSQSPASIAPPPDVSHLPSMFNAQIPPGVAGVLNDPTKTLPDVATTPALPKVTPASAPQQAGGGVYQQLINMGVPPLAIKTAAESNDPMEAVSALVKHYTTPVFGQGKIPYLPAPGGAFRAAQVVGGNEALAAQVAAEKEAELATGAKYNIVNQPTIGANGQQGPTVPMTQAQLLSQLQGGTRPGNMPQLPENGPPVNLNFRNAPPSQVNAALRDMTQQQGPGNGLGAYTFGTPSPLTTKQAETNIETRALGQRANTSGAIKQLETNFVPAYDTATKTIPLLHESLAILDSGKVITGAGANFQLSFGRLLSAAGFNAAKDSVANTQAFLANTAKSVMANVKQLGSGSGISDADREYAAKAAGGDISADEESIRRIIDIGDRTGRLLIQKHNERAASVAKATDTPELTATWSVPMPDTYVNRYSNARAPAGGRDKPTPQEAAAELARRQRGF